jgi:hypothetical protein
MRFLSRKPLLIINRVASPTIAAPWSGPRKSLPTIPQPFIKPHLSLIIPIINQ